MSNTKWVELGLSQCFSKIKTKRLKYKTSELPSKPVGEFTLPALTAGIQNQGLNNYVPNTNATVLKNVISISANGANTGATFYQDKEFTVLQDAYAIKWIYTNDILNDNHYLYLTTLISKVLFGKYEWTNKAGWEKVKNTKINIPIEDGNIHFELMSKLINHITSSHLSKIETYLINNNMDNICLTSHEEKALHTLKYIQFKDFKVTDLFNIKNSGNILSSWVVENSGTTPYLCASTLNNSVSSYIQYDDSYLDEGNCIFIGGKTFVVTYQKNNFFSNDSHNLILKLKEEKYRNKICQLFIATCIKSSLGHKYSWGDSISSSKIKKDSISLPVKDGKPDYEFMENYISAIQKLTVKKILFYLTDKKSKVIS